MENILYQNDLVKVEIEPFEIPWIKIFAKEQIKEFSMCSSDLKAQIWQILDIIEKIMLQELNPTKINIASFGNYVPQVHFHIQARFEKDSYFPEPTWGKKQRDGNIDIKNLDSFYDKIKKNLEAIDE